MKNKRNIAILAHVDAGKTTITENFLFQNGNTRSKGSVDKGTSQTDFLQIEKDRGISVRTAAVSFERKGMIINLIDTPGHSDFSSETERALLAADAAVLVISAAEGVQSHTETLWQAVQKMEIPCLIFINKIDRDGADSEQVFEEIHSELTKNAIALQLPVNEGSTTAKIRLVWTEKGNKNTAEQAAYNQILESIVEHDEQLLEQFFNDEKISYRTANQKLIELIHARKITPVLFGSAKNEVGTAELSDAIIDYLPAPKTAEKNKLSAVIFKIEHDKMLGKIAHVRLFSGEIRNRDLVFNASRNVEEKAAQIKKIHTKKYEDTGVVSAGDIAVISGFSAAKAGDSLGKFSTRSTILSEISLLSVKVTAPKAADFPAMLKAFLQLADEDPTLNLEWQNEQRELHIKIQGKIQLEILQGIIETRFGLQVEFGKPAIIYKETPAKSGEGYVRYWMPKPCWAIMRFKIEPAPRGSGVKYRSIVSVNDIKQRYQNQVEKAIPQALRQGIKGWEVTDVKITLIAGEDHVMHTHPPDFTVATPMGIMNGLVNTDTTLLEPILSFKINAPEDMLGVIAGDLTKMRATFGNPEFKNGKFTMKGTVPAATSLDYPALLASRTAGKGKISSQFHSYQNCTLEQGEVTDYKGISPLDTAKYILHARKAL